MQLKTCFILSSWESTIVVFGFIIVNAFRRVVLLSVSDDKHIAVSYPQLSNGIDKELPMRFLLKLGVHSNRACSCCSSEIKVCRDINDEAFALVASEWNVIFWAYSVITVAFFRIRNIEAVEVLPLAAGFAAKTTANNVVAGFFRDLHHFYDIRFFDKSRVVIDPDEIWRPNLRDRQCSASKPAFFCRHSVLLDRWEFNWVEFLVDFSWIVVGDYDRHFWVVFLK